MIHTIEPIITPLTDLPQPFYGCRVNETDSTMNLAQAAWNAGHRHGYTVIADTQTAGQGSNGRNWVTVPGNLSVTTIIEPEKYGLHTVASWRWLDCAVAGVMLDVVRGLGVAAEYHEGNDIFVVDSKLGRAGNGAARKICGFLTKPLQNDDWRKGVMIGIGLNITGHPPDDVLKQQVTYKNGYYATSLAAEKINLKGINTRSVLVNVLEKIPTSFLALRHNGIAATWQKLGLMDDAGQVVLGRRDGESARLVQPVIGYTKAGDYLVELGGSFGRQRWRPLTRREIGCR